MPILPVIQIEDHPCSSATAIPSDSPTLEVGVTEEASAFRRRHGPVLIWAPLLLPTLLVRDSRGLLNVSVSSWVSRTSLPSISVLSYSHGHVGFCLFQSLVLSSLSKENKKSKVKGGYSNFGFMFDGLQCSITIGIYLPQETKCLVMLEPGIPSSEQLLSRLSSWEYLKGIQAHGRSDMEWFGRKLVRIIRF